MLVQVVNDSQFEYSGGVYTSLSAIAQKITGHQTSGIKFFGLKN
ncbi:MAG: DUF2924 domain-containing protein [Alphaproteobacteria bacterium]|nr:DUF2924 domain-containing protein [Alphaproteobacteria bacterium]MBL0717983.1 DUF2924 domain-containing protein [Alphaproteobacteria bacterium]